jgi:hypothetical protein
VDIAAVQNEIEDLEGELTDVREKMKEYLNKLEVL